MRNKWYKALIIERFMTGKEQREFDARYQNYKIISFGQKVIKKNWIQKLMDNKNS